jgi:hypothetical protein
MSAGVRACVPGTASRPLYSPAMTKLVTAMLIASSAIGCGSSGDDPATTESPDTAIDAPISDATIPDSATPDSREASVPIDSTPETFVAEAAAETDTAKDVATDVDADVDETFDTTDTTDTTDAGDEADVMAETAGPPIWHARRMRQPTHDGTIVSIDGTSITTTTDVDGAYSLALPDAGPVGLTFRNGPWEEHATGITVEGGELVCHGLDGFPARLSSLDLPRAHRFLDVKRSALAPDLAESTMGRGVPLCRRRSP